MDLQGAYTERMNPRRLYGTVLTRSNDSPGVRLQSGSAHQNHDQRNDEKGAEEAATVVTVVHVKSPLARNVMVLKRLSGAMSVRQRTQVNSRHFAHETQITGSAWRRAQLR